MATKTLEIHHIGVGGGDCTLVVVRDSKGEIVSNLLIDAGGTKSGGIDRMHAYIEAGKLYRETGTEKYFDCFIASHYHEDHTLGTDSLVENYRFKRIIDIGDKSDGLHHVSYVDDAVKGRRYKETLDHGVVCKSPDRIVIPFLINKTHEGSELVLNIMTWEKVEDKNAASKDIITLTCMAGGGVVIDSFKKAPYPTTGMTKPGDQNDLSLGLIIEWKAEDFRYFSAGDAGGPVKSNGESSHIKSECAPTQYMDLETRMGNYLKDNGLNEKITVFKANHHGSRYSNVPEFLKMLGPETIIVPCHKSRFLPHLDFLTSVKEQSSIKCIAFANEARIDPGKDIGKWLDVDIKTNLRMARNEKKKREILVNERPGLDDKNTLDWCTAVVILVGVEKKLPPIIRAENPKIPDMRDEKEEITIIGAMVDERKEIKGLSVSDSCIWQAAGYQIIGRWGSHPDFVAQITYPKVECNDFLNILETEKIDFRKHVERELRKFTPIRRKIRSIIKTLLRFYTHR